MNEKTFKTLEFHKILNSVREFAISDKTKEAINNDIVETERDIIEKNILEVDDASTMLRYGHVELAGISDIREFVRRSEIGSILGVRDFNMIASLLNRKKTLENLIANFEEDEIVLEHIKPYVSNLEDLHFIYKKIKETVDEATVLDHASTTLLRIRRKISSEEGKIKDRLNDIVRKMAVSYLIISLQREMAVTLFQLMWTTAQNLKGLFMMHSKWTNDLFRTNGCC